MAKSIIYTIDDDIDFNMILEMSMKPYDIDVVTHTTVEEFTKTVKTKKPDLCIIDLNLSQRSGEGYQLVQAMRNIIGKELPIIVMSRRGDLQDVQYAMEVGANDFVAKPLDDIFLLTKLKVYLKNNPRLLDVSLPMIRIPKEDEDFKVSKEVNVIEVSAGQMIVESNCLFSEESLIIAKSKIITEIFKEDNSIPFKVLETWTEGNKYRTRVEFEFNEEDYFSLRRWLKNNKDTFND